MSDENVERVIDAVKSLLWALRRGNGTAAECSVEIEALRASAYKVEQSLARTSRPREAGRVRIVCDLCDGKGTISVVDDYDDEGRSIYAPEGCPECEGRLYVERTAYVDAPVAPEACPRCGSEDRLSFTYPECRSRGPHDPWHDAQPASAKAEGGGSKYVPKVGDVVHLKMDDPADDRSYRIVVGVRPTHSGALEVDTKERDGMENGATHFPDNPRMGYAYLRPATPEERKAAGLATPAPSAAAPTEAEVEDLADVIEKTLRFPWRTGGQLVDDVDKGRSPERVRAMCAARAVLAHLGKGAK